MAGKYLEIISQIVLWYENSFHLDWFIQQIHRIFEQTCRPISLLMSKTSSQLEMTHHLSM